MTFLLYVFSVLWRFWYIHVFRKCDMLPSQYNHIKQNKNVLFYRFPWRLSKYQDKMWKNNDLKNVIVKMATFGTVAENGASTLRIKRDDLYNIFQLQQLNQFQMIEVSILKSITHIHTYEQAKIDWSTWMTLRIKYCKRQDSICPIHEALGEWAREACARTWWVIGDELPSNAEYVYTKPKQTRFSLVSSLTLSSPWRFLCPSGDERWDSQLSHRFNICRRKRSVREYRTRVCSGRYI